MSLARDASQIRRQASRRLTEDEKTRADVTISPEKFLEHTEQ